MRCNGSKTNKNKNIEQRVTFQVDGAVKAICNRLAAAEMNERASKDLAEQCVKLLEHVCQRETLAVYDAGGMNAMLTLVRAHGEKIHKVSQITFMNNIGDNFKAGNCCSELFFNNGSRTGWSCCC